MLHAVGRQHAKAAVRQLAGHHEHRRVVNVRQLLKSCLAEGSTLAGYVEPSRVSWRLFGLSQTATAE